MTDTTHDIDALPTIWANTTIWASGERLAGEWNYRDVGSSDDTEYVRADLATPDPMDDPRVKALVEALRESQLQIDYLHGRLGEETGSGNAVRSRNVAALAALKGNNND